MSERSAYQLPFGAQLLDERQTRFRIWAPGVDRISVDVMDGDQVSDTFPMQREDAGYFSVTAPVADGTAYFYRLPDGMQVPDPASRLQRDDVNGPSVVVDPRSYRWRQTQWRGRPWEEMVIYEVHPGCWGGFTGIEQRLNYLRDLGVTAIELMPIADFPGERNWGYDGVMPFAPDRSYGTPEELKQLIDAAHEAGICVYLDVVYNHFGPEGNYLHTYAPQFFNPEKHSPWGAAIDFEQVPVREFFANNALYWLSEYRFDGLRFDAVHAISEADWLDEMAAQVRAETGDRHIHLMLENERNRATHLEKDFDAQWNDDGHNVLHVLLTDEHEGYYGNYVSEPTKKLARMLESGFVYQGEPSPRHGNKPRGEPSGHLAPTQFVLFLQNHDQIGNRACGERLTTLTDPQALRAAVTLQLLCPQIPLLFMDEERGSTTPFLYFTDFHGELAAAVRDGRRKEFQAFSAFADPEAQQQIPDPNEEETFLRSAAFKVEDKPQQQAFHDFYRQLLTLRHRTLVPHLAEARSLGAFVLGEKAVTARWELPGKGVLSLIVNLAANEVDVTAPQGKLLFESRQHAGESLKSGSLPGYSSVAFLDGDAVENSSSRE
ncbi:malto-oligosyltrehalose trehalohydrolase [Proteobacteria bacterium 005FR1]|nr:malto-oligosyltrehalose trehalohydrolase [Proteobacteria bacterium 005FR1]